MSEAVRGYWSGGTNKAGYSSVIASEVKYSRNNPFNSDYSVFGSGGPRFKPKLVE